MTWPRPSGSGRTRAGSACPSRRCAPRRCATASRRCPHGSAAAPTRPVTTRSTRAACRRRATGAAHGNAPTGTLVVARTADDLAEAERLRAYQSGLGLPITPLRPTALRDREPALSPRVRGGAHAPGDHQVDPRRLLAAL